MTEGVEFDTSALDAAMVRLAGDIDDVARDASLATARATVQRTRVPRRSGRLAASLRARSVSSTDSGTFAAIATMSTPYAGWIEYGGTRGRPYVSQGRYLHAGARAAPSLASAAEQGLQRVTAGL